MNSATLMTISADFPAALTTRELERVLDTLSARDRADLKWMRPGLAGVLDRLLTEPLNRETIDTSAREFARITLGLKRVMRRLTQARLFFSAFSAIVSKRRDRLVTFLGSETLVGHVEQTTKAIEASLESLFAGASPAQVFDQLPDDDQKLDALIDGAPHTHLSGILYAEVLLVALFEAEDKGGSAERGRELARLALVAAVDGVMATRELGFTVLVQDTASPPNDDELLATLASRALAGADDEAARAGQWVRGRMPEYVEPIFTVVPAVATPRARTRLTRHLGAVIGGQLGDSPGVWLLAEGMPMWLSATPELVERARSLHGALVEVVTIQTPHDPSFIGWHTHAWRLVRIDPAAGGEQAPDSATRTQDMLHDWDELLHRLAR